jgi:2-desacetyl-2-hydroxyethyl bacteriochlorophyllide A dehydrogenase
VVDGRPAAIMPAAVLAAPGEVRIEERPVPEVGAHDVLVEVAACGICGTDLHLVIDGWGALGVVPGHEYAGRVAAVGAEAAGVAVGDLVTANPQPGCGTCPGCRSGRPSLCRGLDLLGGSWQGGFARYVRIRADQVHRLPGGMGPTVGALAEPLAVALHALTRGGVDAGDRVLVTGAGPLGLLVIAALHARGIADVVASEPVDGRRERAAALGVDAVRPDDLPAPLLPTDVADDPFDVVLECAGRPDAAAAGLRGLRPGGRLVIVGAGLDPLSLDPTRTMVQELEVVGALNYDASGFDDALALLGNGRLPLDELREPDPVPLEALADACRELAAGRISRKVLVAPV